MASEKTRRYGKNILDVVYLKKLNSNLYSKKITCYMKKSKGKAARLTQERFQRSGKRNQKKLFKNSRYINGQSAAKDPPNERIKVQRLDGSGYEIK